MSDVQKELEKESASLFFETVQIQSKKYTKLIKLPEFRAS